jgi:branched-chain amino acid transport system substrate-binding protein
LKRLIFLIIASVLVVGLVLPGVVSAAPTEIKIIVAGPMDYMQGRHMWWGAKLANNEIGTFSVGGSDYAFHLYQVNIDEIKDYAGAGTALLNALTTGDSAGAKFVIAGFRTEAATNEITAAISQNATYYITGAASYSLTTGCDYYYSAGYKYVFRGTPINDVFLLNNSFLMLTMVCKTLEGEGVAPKVAIFGESLEWAEPIIEAGETLIPAFGWTLGPVELVKDTDTSGIVRPALQTIKDANCNVIWTVMSGAVGTVFSTQKGSMDIPAIAVGINVEAQASDYWDSTLGGCAYEITMGTWAEGVTQTGKTAAFITNFKALTENTNHEFPSYTAAAYDVLYGIKAAMVGANSVDNTVLIPWQENLANIQVITSGNASYYPRWDGSTFGYWTSVAGTNPLGAGDGILGALNSTVYNAIYSSLGYQFHSALGGTNFTMPPFNTHDLIYGPGYVTGIACQWVPEEE